MIALREEGLSDATLPEAIQFVRDSNPFAQHTWGWDTGRFVDFRWGSNNVRAADNANWFSDACHIFRDRSAIRAVSIAEYGSEHECILTRSEEPDVVAAILSLLVERHRERGISVVLEFTREANWLRDICRDAGLTERDDTGREWEYDLAAVDMAVSVPVGYTIVTLDEQSNLDRGLVARCIERAFDVDHDLEPALRSIERNPMFLPELSAVAIDSEGAVAAYCRGTVDPVSGVCGIDPICTHPDHHRRGLGKAVVRKVMANQWRLGGRYAYIGSAPPPAPGTFLYAALGPSRVYIGCEWRA